ncbi:MAG: ribosome maturation factor RimP [Oscillospiraceae bacterium]|nr:ribosome maturation factor RimP [Oscillospiraceae bacterium]
MSEKKKPIAEQVMEIAAPLTEQMGYILWDVFYGKEGQNLVLRLTIDSLNGIGIQDCEKVSRAVDPLLDDISSLTDAYSFEVSSPGLGRKIHTDNQYTAYIGKDVLIHLIRADETGTRDYEGILESFNDNQLVVMTENGQVILQRNAVSYTKANDDKDLFNRKGK